MSKNTKSPHRTALILGTILIIAVIILVFLHPLFTFGQIYTTANASNYGRIKGNFNNEIPRTFIFSFFPAEIQDSFSQIDYHYLAKKGDTYAYECYLEFVIENPTDYTKFIEETLDQEASSCFAYDSNFQEYSISNVLDLETPLDNSKDYSIGAAQIGKILYSDNEQRIIFIAIGLYDGGGADTSELGYFFSRFQIDPWEYMQNAYATPYYQDLGILNKDIQ